MRSSHGLFALTTLFSSVLIISLYTQLTELTILSPSLQNKATISARYSNFTLAGSANCTGWYQCNLIQCEYAQANFPYIDINYQYLAVNSCIYNQTLNYDFLLQNSFLSADYILILGIAVLHMITVFFYVARGIHNQCQEEIESILSVLVWRYGFVILFGLSKIGIMLGYVLYLVYILNISENPLSQTKLILNLTWILFLIIETIYSGYQLSRFFRPILPF